MIVSTRGLELCATHHESLWLVTTGNKDWDDEVFREYCVLCFQQWRAHGPFQAIINYSPTRPPTAIQRKMLAEMWEQHGIEQVRRRAIVTQSKAVADGLGAISRHVQQHAMGTKARVFRPRELVQAFDWLREEVVFDIAQAKDVFEQLIRYAGHTLAPFG